MIDEEPLPLPQLMFINIALQSNINDKTFINVFHILIYAYARVFVQSKIVLTATNFVELTNAKIFRHAQQSICKALLP